MDCLALYIDFYIIRNPWFIEIYQIINIVQTVHIYSEIAHIEIEIVYLINYKTYITRVFLPKIDLIMTIELII